MSDHNKAPASELPISLHRVGRSLAIVALLLPGTGCNESTAPNVPFLPRSADRTSECSPAWVETKGLGSDGQTTRYDGASTRVGGVVVQLFNNGDPVKSGPAHQLYIKPMNSCTFPDFVQLVESDIPPTSEKSVKLGECWAFNISDWMTFSHPDQTADEELMNSYIEHDYDIERYPGADNTQVIDAIDLRPEPCP